ncbi:TIP41-like family-domain-containing protein [Radiomyces spectabilis]|uniref:TIP41-like family-domain-containing protein n=1 Tax=Radiomyces spectabilis TaxID=64574 RepID=UPI00221F027D|nr:TIP41-like family-domain-containing protein [Radiomyces spectabilis]KAI8391162.1 TIP41-like family-domain-containing protein [Radiomyces spectabilis]
MVATLPGQINWKSMSDEEDLKPFRSSTILLTLHKFTMDQAVPKITREGNSREGFFQSIEYKGWRIISKKAAICNSAEMDSIQTDIGIPPPEMVFGNSEVLLKNEDFELSFKAYDALRMVDTSSNSSEHIKVAYADDWSRKSAANHTDVKDVIKPYDWTYSTEYQGTCAASFTAAEEPKIDIERLKKPEPILFYDENILYEDELADNGTAMLSIRLRVMPSCFLVLQRFFLRVDDVLFRINDTRIYHEFGTSYVVREYTSKEAPYQYIRKIMGHGDVSLLNDANWIGSKLPEPPQTFVREHVRLKR